MLLFGALPFSAIRCARNIPELHEALALWATAEGFAYYMFSTVFTVANCARRIEITNFPQLWQDRYTAQNYQACDPIIKQAKRSVLAFEWSEVLSQESELYLTDAASFGLSHGVTVPLRANNSTFGFLSLAHPTQTPLQHCGQHDAHAHILFGSSLVFHKVLLIQGAIPISSEPRILTRRERDCLQFSQHGLKSKQIADRLGIAVSTVSFHIDNSIKKLGSASRTAAVAKALELGELDPADVSPCETERWGPSSLRSPSYIASCGSMSLALSSY